MLTGYFFHKWALEAEQRARESERQARESRLKLQESQRSLEELTIQRLVAERQLHDAKRPRYEAEYKLLALKDQRRRRRNRRRRALR